MTLLSVNVNKIALLRNSRGGTVPSVTEAARVCIDAGCHGITVHPRPDQRHIRPGDVHDLARMLTVEFNIEGNPFAEAEGAYPGFMKLVRDAKPAQATLVPDDPGQLTSDHGWNLKKDLPRVKPLVTELKDLGVRVSLFMDPDLEQIELAATSGADRIELYTEDYAAARARGDCQEVFAHYAAAAVRAQELGLGVNAGHDLNLDNLAHFLTIADILEVSIGHALIADALKMGLSAAVTAYLECLPG
ncbi:MAG: pyridoxine 5'-phosphate synthase [Anaerolineaceae bacterium]|nr:pyridoxine 5'-phosphate synthase [Anaerolineaceae bacterium]